MTIIIEDGTGLENAQSYCDNVFYNAFVAEMGLASNFTLSQVEAALVTASKRWVDWQHNFSGSKLNEDQALEFPRDESGVPLKIKQATAYAAWLHLNNALLVDTVSLSTSGDIESESKQLSVMSKSVSYAKGTAQRYSRVLPAELKNLLVPYLLAGGGAAVRRVL